MDLVSVQGDVPNRLAEKRFRYQPPCASQGDLRRLMVVLIGNRQRPRIDSEPSIPSGSRICSPSICMPPQIPVIRPVLAVLDHRRSSPSVRIQSRSSAVCLLPGRITTSAPRNCSGLRQNRTATDGSDRNASKSVKFESEGNAITATRRGLPALAHGTHWAKGFMKRIEAQAIRGCPLRQAKDAQDTAQRRDTAFDSIFHRRGCRARAAKHRHETC